MANDNLPEWMLLLEVSAKHYKNSLAARRAETKRRREAGEFLWLGVRAAILAWLPDAASDPTGMRLYYNVLEGLGGEKRKSSASKAKTVALAVVSHHLKIEQYVSLHDAYEAARILTQHDPSTHGATGSTDNR